jgi:hypothetical protein
MIRRFVLPLLGSGLLLAGTATGVLAKCEGPNPPEFCNEIVASILVGGNGSFTAGTPTPVNLWLVKGEGPYDVKSVLLSFYRYQDATLVRAEAELTADRGHWRAVVTIPSDGGWRVDAYVVGADGATVVLPIPPGQVVKPPAAPPVTTPTTPTPPVTPTTPSLPALPIALLVAGIAAAGMAGVALRDRTRRRTGALASSATSTRGVDPV